MPRPWRIVYAGAKYHVTSRGNGRQKIFLSENDYLRFLKQLKHALNTDGVILYAYVLMPNHFHLFIETPLGNIQKFMQRLNTAYSMYFRYKHNKPGHCLQGRYKAKLVEGDDYIIRLTRYIHLNPIMTDYMRKKSNEERLVALKEFRWSSYHGYINAKRAQTIIEYRWLNLMERKTAAGCRKTYQKYVIGMVNSTDKILGKALRVSRYAIGDDQFVRESELILKNEIRNKNPFGDVKLPEKAVIALDKIEDMVAHEFCVEVSDLRLHGHQCGVAKSVSIEMCCALSGMNQRRIAEHFSYKTDSSVTTQRKILKKKIEADAVLKARVNNLKTHIINSIM